MISSIVLAAGKGTRMKSTKPKVIQKVLGYEMINLVLKTLSEISIDNNLLVLGYKSDEVIASIDSRFSYDTIIQEEQLGTGHAIKICKDYYKNIKGNVIVTCGDTPLITAETYSKLIDYHVDNKNDLTVLTTEMENSFGYGRIIRDSADNLIKIVEEKDASDKEKLVKEVNAGVYIFSIDKLFDKIDLLDDNNTQSEYYLTDMIKIFLNNDFSVGAYITNDNQEVMGINDLIALEKANKSLKHRINKNHMLAGVQLLDSNNTLIGPNVILGEGTVIYPNNTLLGNVTIGKENVLMPGNTIIDSVVGNNCEIGPMCYLRNGVEIADNCRIGNFVEVKNSHIGDGTKAAHLTYIGDTEVGRNVNFGCGSITANYDGKNKHRTIIGDNVFIGSNVNMIAPLEIKKNSFIAAGATVGVDIDENKFILPKREYIVKENKNKEKNV